MTLPDDSNNPKASKKLGRAADALGALRQAMERQVKEDNAPKTKPKKPKTSEVKAEEIKVEPAPQPQTEFKPEPQAEPAPDPAAKAEAKTSPDTPPHMPDPVEWSMIMMRLAQRSQVILTEFWQRNKDKPVKMPNFEASQVMTAFAELGKRMMADSETFVDAQIALWQSYLGVWRSVMAHMQGKQAAPVVMPSPQDKRFKAPDWQTNWMFDYIKQTYLLTANWAQGLVLKETAQLNPHLARKIEFYTRQMVDAIAPSNFWMTNPEVLKTTIESQGENLVRGLERLLEDIEKGHGTIQISMTNPQSFAVGKNLAMTPGKVVYQNGLMQLIQYAPETAQVRRVPLLIIPPWINKYYILDLREKNSFTHYLVQQGFTVFCISWVNPDRRHALVQFDDYMASGAIEAMRVVNRLTGENTINTVGYCIGGTLQACMLAYLKGLKTKPDDLPGVASSTFLAAMIDFAEPGDLGVFIDEEQVTSVEKRMAEQGFLDAASMMMTFNLLRANDLIWPFVINNYLLGRDPFPFDILYWNSDATNLPAAMHSYYLRKMYMENKLVQPNALSMKGVPIDLRRIDTPVFMISTHDDHIAPWTSTYAATQLYSGPRTFVLGGSGHIAGIINHPDAQKYCYWTNDKLPVAAEDWLKDAQQHKGSWWPAWIEWLSPFSGEMVPARTVTEGIEDAPGSYVKIRAA